MDFVMIDGQAFRYTDNPLRDLKRLSREGLRPFHVDADFDPIALGD